jgi:UDP-glucose 4-epimerase
MVQTILDVTGTAGESWAEPEVRGRRAGDPARVVASADRIREVLGWTAHHDVREMVASAWEGWTGRQPSPARG